MAVSDLSAALPQPKRKDGPMNRHGNRQMNRKQTTSLGRLGESF
jgi:hypothetical protein